MICFRDTTFCASPGCKGECGRQWTQELSAQAKRWWGNDNAPVAFSFFCGDGGLTLGQALEKKNDKQR